MSSEVSIKCADDFALSGRFYEAENSNGSAVVIASAMGVPQRYYASFAKFLGNNGFHVLTFDYRGIGASRTDSIPGTQMRMREWGQLDLDAAIRWLTDNHSPDRLYLVGHSCGGQLLGLAESSEKVNAAVFVASQSGSYSEWPWPGKLGVIILWFVLLPALGWRRKYFPARALGISSVDVPAGVIAEWASWGRSKGYLFDPVHQIDLARYNRIDMPILAYGFDDDGYAPAAAVDALLVRYSSAEIIRKQVNPASIDVRRIAHFGFFREQIGKPLWQDLADWLKHQSGGEST